MLPGRLQEHIAILLGRRGLRPPAHLDDEPASALRTRLDQTMRAELLAQREVLIIGQTPHGLDVGLRQLTEIEQDVLDVSEVGDGGHGGGLARPGEWREV